MFTIKARFAKILAETLAGLLVFLAEVLVGFFAVPAGILAGLLLEKFLPKSSRATPLPTALNWHIDESMRRCDSLVKNKKKADSRN